MAQKIDKIIEENITNLYNLGIGTNRLSRRFNLHRNTIQAVLIRNNIKLRKTSPYNTYDINYFNKYSKENSYWAGFIMADGCLRSERKCLEIGLSLKDKDHLLKFKNAINSEGNIREYYNHVRIGICGSWFYQSLKKNFGIVPKKSQKIHLPKKTAQKILESFHKGGIRWRWLYNLHHLSYFIFCWYI